MAASKEKVEKQSPRPRVRGAEASQPQTSSQPQTEVPAETVETVSVEVAEQRLQRAATQAISGKSADIIRNLAEKAAKGNAASAKVLLELMRGQKQSKSKPGRGRSDSALIPLRAWLTEPEVK